MHSEESESDYFSALDDLVEQQGSGHIGNSELTSGLYYGYVVVDLPLLVSNLTGCAAKDWATAERELAAGVVDRLIRLLATVSPGAKLGSTAPHSYAQAVLVEAGNAQPRTLANAFQKPAATRPDALANAYEALARHVRELDDVYGRDGGRQVVGVGQIGDLRRAVEAGDVTRLDGLARWASAQVAAG